MRIAFAGGGTGGHVFPIRALIQHIESHPEYKHKASALVWFGEHESLEESTAQEFSHVKFIPIRSGKLRRSPGIKEVFENIKDIGGLIYGIVQCVRQLKKQRIDVIFCKGGYVSLPVVIAGWILHKRILLHDSDTQAGISNKICAKFATTIFTGFAGVFPGKEIVVGQILSQDLISTIGEQSGNNWETIGEQSGSNWETIGEQLGNNQGTIGEQSGNNWGIPERSGKTNILVTGGSQGSESIYRPLSELIRKNKYKESHFYVILGTKNTGLRKIFDGIHNVTCYDFVSQQEMGGLLSVCDVAITRAGTTSLAEEKLFGLKLVMIPIPWTHDQLKNAEYYVKHHGDTLLKQDESFLLQFPGALEKIQGYKKSRSRENLTLNIERAKETICKILFG